MTTTTIIIIIKLQKQQCVAADPETRLHAYSPGVAAARLAAADAATAAAIRPWSAR